MTNTNPATAKQIAFIASLMTDRVVGETFAQAVNTAGDKLTVDFASNAINALLTMPRKPKALAGADTLQALISSIPHAKYAVDSDILALILQDTRVSGDLGFFETRIFNGTEYVRQLHGAPGDFTRTRLTRRDTEALVKFLAESPAKWSQLFGKHHTCCGKCGAPLTDEESRRVSMGPVCRGAFGI